MAGDDLIFPSGVSQLNAVNDYPAGTAFNSILVSGSGYTLTGNAINLQVGLTASASGTTTVGLGITLGSAGLQSTSTLQANGNVNWTGNIGVLSSNFNLIVAAGDTFRVSGGSFFALVNVTQSGGGQLILTGAANQILGSWTVESDSILEVDQLLVIGSGNLDLQPGSVLKGPGIVDGGPLPLVLGGSGPPEFFLGEGSTVQLSQNPAPATPIAVTGFNQSVVWANFNSSPLSSTTTGFDSASGNVFFEDGAPFTPPNAGLPVNGTVVNGGSGTTFQLQPYSGSNVLIPAGASNTLTLTTPFSYQDLSFLVAAANGAATFTATLNFTTGSTTTVTGLIANDWHSGGTNIVGGLDVVGRTSYGLTVASGYNLYEVDYTLAAADQSRMLTSINFNETSGGSLGIFAVSGLTNPAPQLFTGAFNVDGDATFNEQSPLTTIGSLSVGNNKVSLTGVNGAVLTTGAVNLSGSPTFSTATNTTLQLGALNDGGTPTTITIGGAGNLSFDAPTQNFQAGDTVIITGDAVELPVSGDLGTLTTVCDNGDEIDLNAEQIIAGLKGVGNVNLGDDHTLTVGSANNESSTFSGVLDDTETSGSSEDGLWKNGTGTFILNGPSSTYSGGTKVFAGTLQLDSTLTRSQVTVAGGTLAGTGTIDNGVRGISGTIQPGDPQSILTAPALASPLTVGDGLVLYSAATYQIGIGDSNSPNDCGQTVVTSGTIDLNHDDGPGATLVVQLNQLNGTTLVPNAGQQFTIIQNNTGSPIIGQFNGLGQGAIFQAQGSNVEFEISYKGGTNGNSVVLTALGPQAATKLALVQIPASVTAGNSFTFTVQAEDANGFLFSNYTGKVHFTSTDPNATLPPDSTLTNGQGTFTATLVTAGPDQTIIATDTSNAAENGTSNPILVGIAASTPPAKWLVNFQGAATIAAGLPFLFTLRAADQYGNPLTVNDGSINGNPTLSSSDTSATFGQGQTLTNGFGYFTATFDTAGIQTINAKYLWNGQTLLTGVSAPIAVVAGQMDHFAVTSTPSEIAPGTSVNLTVVAQDKYDNTVTNYAGNVVLTCSSDPQAYFPNNNTPLSNGVGSFTAWLYTAGSQTISAADSSNQNIKGSVTVTVDASNTSVLAITPFNPSSSSSTTVVAGQSLSWSKCKISFRNGVPQYITFANLTLSASLGATTVPFEELADTGTLGYYYCSSSLKMAGQWTFTAWRTVETS